MTQQEQLTREQFNEAYRAHRALQIYIGKFDKFSLYQKRAYQAKLSIIPTSILIKAYHCVTNR